MDVDYVEQDGHLGRCFGGGGIVLGVELVSAGRRKVVHTGVYLR